MNTILFRTNGGCWDLWIFCSGFYNLAAQKEHYRDGSNASRSLTHRSAWKTAATIPAAHLVGEEIKRPGDANQLHYRPKASWARSWNQKPTFPHLLLLLLRPRYNRTSMLITQLYLTLVTSWTVARQALLSTGFSRQEYWSGLPLPSPGDLPNPGIEPASLASPSLAGRFFTTEPPGKHV